MNYIIFDLEWNQAFNKDYENPRIPFEIIEIGAVKLDSKFNLIDTFSSIIKPRLYKKLESHIKTILNYDEDTLFKGKPFDMVCREFLKWCGEDFIFGTWGPMDLSHLQNNMEYYYMNPYDKPVKYYNIQQIYVDNSTDDKVSCKLENAVTALGINIDRPFHSAVNDAFYTAEVLKKLKLKDISDYYTYDVYNSPHNKEDEILSRHKHYSEKITCDYDTKHEALQDKELFTIRCYKCGRKISRKVKWFSSSTNTYNCVGKCWYHGLILGKIRFKQNKEGKLFAIKTLSPTDRAGLEEIKDRQDELRIRRQEKRHNKKSDDSIIDNE